MMKLSAPLTAATLTLAALSQAWAGDTIGYLDAATLGAGVGVSTVVAPGIGIRADVHTLSISRNGTTSGGLTYDGQFKLTPVELLVDYYPMGGGFHLSAGAVLGSGKLSVTARPSASGQITLNGTTYSGLNPATDSVVGEVKMFDGLSPYLGIGFSAHPGQSSGLSVKADLGVVFSRLKTSLTVNGPLAADPTVSANLDAERRNLESKANVLKTYPVISVGLGYTF